MVTIGDERGLYYGIRGLRTVRDRFRQRPRDGKLAAVVFVVGTAAHGVPIVHYRLRRVVPVIVVVVVVLAFAAILRFFSLFRKGLPFVPARSCSARIGEQAGGASNPRRSSTTEA